MQKFFIPSDSFIGGMRPAVGGKITIHGGDARHISRSLRMAAGDRIAVCDMAHTEFDCIISAFTADTVELEVCEVKQNNTEPLFSACLYQALPKGDKMDIIVQKAVETGVCTITPFISERCISRPDTSAAEKKRVRWQKIAEEAAKQCGRGCIPQIMPVTEYSQVIAGASLAAEHGALSFLCYEGEGTILLGKIINQSTELPRTIHFIVGSEGGFSGGEVDAALSAGLKTAGLGRRILRCETAPIFVLSCITYAFELC